MRLLKGIHWMLKLIGVIAILAMVVLGGVSYLSRSTDLWCNGYHKFERERAGKTYHCVFG